jgi:outer membrane biosynthesis protein TonB
MSFEIGQTFGDYEVIDVLGAGGMGKVYKVRNIISHRVEAAKVLLPNLESDPDLADRFLREIRVHASLDHPNIAGLHTALRIGNQILMVMEYVEGKTLAAILHEGRVPLKDGIEYIRQVLSALAYAHSHGVIHRDIKPANMMLTPEGTVKLMDFGIAKAAADRRLTQTGRTVGSLYYMSPEQINGATELDGRSDLYSVGVSLYEIVTGKRPFEGDSDYSVMAAHLQMTPVPPIELDPALPPALNEIVLMSIAKDPAQRFQSADAFRTALGNVLQSLGGQVTAASVPAAAVAPKPPAGSRRGLYMLAGSLATLVVIVLAATQVPRWLQTRAVEKPVQVTTPAQPATSVPPPVVTEPGAAEPQPRTPERTPSPAAVIEPPPQRAQPARQTPPPPKTAPARGDTRKAPPQEPVSQRSQPASPPSAPANTAAQQTRPPAPDPAKTAALRELNERMMLMATRVAAVKTSLSKLQQAQSQAGLGMRGDITAAHQRMELYLDGAESALKAGDADGAKKQLDSAERALETLEKFLGM